MSEWQKMLDGLPFTADDPELIEGRRAARAAMAEFNAELDEKRRMAMLPGLFGAFGEGSFIEAPFRCDYGTNIHMGRESFMNFGCVVLDCARVTIGDRVQVGPNVQILAADHPREAELRAQFVELAKPVTIEGGVWVGAGAIICPGVEIGAGSIIGAGSVVNHSIPAGVVAAGNPCRVVRKL